MSLLSSAVCKDAEKSRQWVEILSPIPVAYLMLVGFFSMVVCSYVLDIKAKKQIGSRLKSLRKLFQVTYCFLITFWLVYMLLTCLLVEGIEGRQASMWILCAIQFEAFFFGLAFLQVAVLDLLVKAALKWVLPRFFDADENEKTVYVQFHS